MEKLWLAQYQQGVPHEINPDGYASLLELFDESFGEHKSQIAYENMGTAISYEELDILSHHFAAYLQHLELKKGARVAIMMPNLIQYPVALFGILRAGFTVVNTNPMYTEDEFTHQMKDAGVEAIIVLANFASVVEKSLPNLPKLKHIITTEIGDAFPAMKCWIVNKVVRYIKKMVPNFNIPNAKTYKEILAEGSALSFVPISLERHDIAFIQYTGGTTGIAKGAMLTHRNMLANILQATAWISPLKVGKEDIIVTALPLYHIFSLTANCLTFFKAGAKNILITNPRDTVGFIKQIKKVGFTAITGVNTLFNSLLNHPDFHHVDFSKLKLTLSGGMALQKSVALRWREETHAPILEAYGLTETSPAVTINPLSLKEYNGSIGLPIPSTDISIRDDQSQEVALGERGELCVKGPQVMLGYWQQAEETAHVFWPDGFLRTGDVATMDEKGFIYIVDRIKDMILVSGFNVYPTEIEQVISQMPEVKEVGVIGVVKESGSEIVKACVVKRDQDLTSEDVLAHCRLHLTAYKVPKIVEFYEELPKTNVGKVLRRALK